MAHAVRAFFAASATAAMFLCRRRHSFISQEYGVSAEEACCFGLPCGGTMQLVLEPITRQSGMQTLHDALSRGELVARTLDMATGAVTLGPASTTDGVYFNETRLTTIH
jgi:xanthine dehydrogenase accessory factor